MKKKIRTGLQSKISNIFDGVPIPKKKKQSDAELSDNSNDIKADDSELNSPDRDNINQQSNAQDDNEVVIELSFDQSDSNSNDIVTEESHESASQTKKQVEQEYDGKNQDELISEEKLSEDDLFIIEPLDDDNNISKDTYVSKELHADKKEETEAQVQNKGKFADNEFLSMEQQSCQRENKDIRDDGTQASEINTDGLSEPEAFIEDAEVDKKESKINQSDVLFPKKPLDIQKRIAIKTELLQKPDRRAAKRKLKKPKVNKKDIQKINKKALKTEKIKPAKIKSDAGDSRQKIMVVIAIIMVIVLVLVLSKNYNISFWNTGGSVTIQQPSIPDNIAANIKTIQIDWIDPPIYPESKDIRDPMIAGSSAAINNQESDFVVTGISLYGGQYLATIDTERKREGETVFGAKIIKITENEVEFEREGKKWIQRVGEK